MFPLNLHPCHLNRFILEVGWVRAMIIGWQTAPFNTPLFPFPPLFLVFSHRFNRNHGRATLPLASILEVLRLVHLVV